MNTAEEPSELRATPGEPSRAVRAAGQGLAATVGFGLGGLSGAVVGAVVSDALVELTGRAWDEITSARRRSAASLVLLVADELGETPDRMLSYALSDRETTALMADALAAAAHTLNDQKVTALSRAVANGLRDDAAAVDEARIVVQALAQLEEPHVRLLLLFVRVKDELTLTVQRRFEWTCIVRGLDPATRRHLLSFMLGLGLFTQQLADSERGQFGAEDSTTSHDLWAPTPFAVHCAEYLLGHRTPCVWEWETQRTEKYPGGSGLWTDPAGVAETAPTGGPLAARLLARARVTACVTALLHEAVEHRSPGGAVPASPLTAHPWRRTTGEGPWSPGPRPTTIDQRKRLWPRRA